MQKTKPKLIDLLLATLENPEIFADPAIEEELDRQKQLAAHKAECAGAFQDLYQTHYITLDTPELSGLELCYKHHHFHTCWMESFQNAIRFVAENPYLPEKHDREFLYYMLGITEIIFADGAVPVN